MTPDECAAVRAAMDRGLEEAAEVLGDGFLFEEDVRRTAAVEVEPPILARIEERLDLMRDVIASGHGCELGAREGASLLRYRDGGFYRPHRDRGHSPSWPAAARRRISAVLFLNDARDIDPAGLFTGGGLRLYADDDTSFIVVPRAGTLLTFRSTLLHEVETVVGGPRDTIVDWFYDAVE